MCLFDMCSSNGRWKWFLENVIMFLFWLMVKFFIFFGKFYRWMIFGFIVSIFFFIFRNIFDSDCLERLLCFRLIKLLLLRIFSIVVLLFIVLCLIVRVFCCGLLLCRMKNRLLWFCLFRYFQVVLFIVRWLEEMMIMVFLNYGDVLILLINLVMFFWL